MGNCNKVFLLAFILQIHFHDFNPFKKILILLEELFYLYYPQAYGHWLPLKMLSNFFHPETCQLSCQIRHQVTTISPLAVTGQRI